MKQILTILLMITFLSCSQIDKKHSDHSIPLQVGSSPSKLHEFDNYFELDFILPIETTKDYLLTSISRVISYKGQYVILDNHSGIFVVDPSTGKIEKHFRKIGTGPGESNKIIDITIDEKEDRILAFNDYQKLLFFDFDGNFIKQESFDRLYDCIIYDKGYVYLYNYGEGYDVYPYSFLRYSLTDKTVERFGNDKKVSFSFRLYGRSIVKSKRIWFGTPVDFDLSFISDKKADTPYTLTPQTMQLTRELMRKAESSNFDANFWKEIKERNVMFGISSIRETDNFLCFRSSQSGIFVFNKSTNKTVWERYVQTDFGLRLYNYFPHDGDDNRIMFVISAQEWMLMYKGEKQFPEITEESNPILLFYKEKTNEK